MKSNIVSDIVNCSLSNSVDYVVGFADLKEYEIKDYANYRYAISIGQKLEDEIINDIKIGPTKEYNALYQKVNYELSNTINLISRSLDNTGINNLPIQPTVDDKDLEESYFDTLRMPFSHKFAATRAGIGWIGKTDLLITKKFGPRVRLATILFNSDEFEIWDANPINESQCGNCSICVNSCPAGAANGEMWNINIDRDEFYDAFKCRSKCRELTKLLLDIDNSICGICVSVCPIGRKV